MKVQVVCTSEIKPDLVSRLIMWWMGVNYSHIFFVHAGKIFHATGEGVNIVDLTEYMKTHKIAKLFELDLDMTEGEFEAYMSGELGKKYGSFQYFGFLFPRWQRLFDNDDSKRICSELVAVLLQRRGRFTLPKDADFMSPHDVVIMIEAVLVQKTLGLCA